MGWSACRELEGGYRRRMSVASPIVDADLAARLIGAQFPKWRDLPVTPVQSQGWDNRTFRLGSDLLMRLPSAERYASQVPKEQKWLPCLAAHLPLQIPEPVAMGRPGDNYPWPWSVYRWIEGVPATLTAPGSASEFATDLAKFLSALHSVDAHGAPPPGAHNFFRGGSLGVYDADTREAIGLLGDPSLARQATALWERALSSSWPGAPVWVHGDFAAGNLLLRDEALKAVIDFGCLAAGDPASDLVIAWTLLPREERSSFRTALGLDDDTWTRAKGWALWKALIQITGLVGAPSHDGAEAQRTLSEVLGGD
jgi:aminoglycoside phosphotransferase (APT) family kinase protein